MSEVKYKICSKCGTQMLRIPDGYICPKCGIQTFDYLPEGATINPPKMTREEALKIMREDMDWDWEKFRREAAKDAMCAMINSCSTDGIFPDPDEVSGMAVLYADNLIAKLKEDGKD